MPYFGRLSTQRLYTCDERLQSICNEAIKVYDFSVLCGHRDEIEQKKLFREGKSKLEYPHSKHKKIKSLAVDIASWPLDWDDRQAFYALAGVMFAVAHSKGIKLRWGGTWGGLQDKNKSGFYDLGHFEIKE